jgi:WD40 repeat protein
VDLASGTWQDSLAIAGLDATTLAFSPDGSLLAVGSRNGRVYIFASSNMALVRELPAHAQEIRSILFTPDCTRMITAGADGLIIVWKP